MSCSGTIRPLPSPLARTSSLTKLSTSAGVNILPTRIASMPSVTRHAPASSRALVVRISSRKVCRSSADRSWSESSTATRLASVRAWASLARPSFASSTSFSVSTHFTHEPTSACGKLVPRAPLALYEGSCERLPSSFLWCFCVSRRIATNSLKSTKPSLFRSAFANIWRTRFTVAASASPAAIECPTSAVSNWTRVSSALRSSPSIATNAAAAWSTSSGSSVALSVCNSSTTARDPEDLASNVRK